MRIIKRTKVSKKKIGKVTLYNHDLEQHELKTIFRLAAFGFDITALAPSNIPKNKNPDLLMLGTYWEMKAGTSSNKATIQTKFRKAVKQSNGKAIFDLCQVKQSQDKAESEIIRLFKETRGMKRIMIIRDDENLLDIFK